MPKKHVVKHEYSTYYDSFRMLKSRITYVKIKIFFRDYVYNSRKVFIFVNPIV